MNKTVNMPEIFWGFAMSINQNLPNIKYSLYMNYYVVNISFQEGRNSCIAEETRRNYDLFCCFPKVRNGCFVISLMDNF